MCVIASLSSIEVVLNSSLSVVTAALEVAGKLLVSQGLASSFRPRRYYTIPKDTLEGILEDVGQLIDFFLIEFQRVLFAENVLHTVTVCTPKFSPLPMPPLCTLPSGKSETSFLSAAVCLTFLVGLYRCFPLLLAH
jgi:hypothetical protein